MSMPTLFSSLLLFLLGLVLTALGGGWFVDAAARLAELLRVPRFLIGATVVSVATTLPELAVSLMAAARGEAGIAAGNAVGSVSANLGLILGLCLIAAPAELRDRSQRFKLALMAGAALALGGLCARGLLTPLGSAAMLALFVAFIAENSAASRIAARKPAPDAAPADAASPAARSRLTCAVRFLAGAAAKLALFIAFIAENSAASRAAARVPAPSTAPSDATSPAAHSRLTCAVRFLAGAAAIAAGARLMCVHAALLARRFGVPEGVIGATLVAMGTSLPELATAVAALRRGQAALSIGNVVGANIIDLTLILPLCALRQGGAMAIPAQTRLIDLPACALLALTALLPALPHRRFTRRQGVALLLIYLLYTLLLTRLRPL